MVSEIRIYFEGDERLREGFHSFLSEVINSARERRIRIQLISCDAKAIGDFMTALEVNRDATNFLLIDAEGPDDGKLLGNLKAHDHWNPPDGVDVSDNQIHFMTQIMESWFLADKDSLSRYFGNNFRVNRLPANPSVEHIDKEDVLNSLNAATKETKKGAYHKTRHAPYLLEFINTQIVRKAAPGCDHLFSVLEEVIQK